MNATRSKSNFVFAPTTKGMPYFPSMTDVQLITVTGLQTKHSRNYQVIKEDGQTVPIVNAFGPSYPLVNMEGLLSPTRDVRHRD
jgi:hypothetical protein